MVILPGVLLFAMLTSHAWGIKLTYTILEELQPFAVGNIAQDAGLDQKYSAEAFAQLRYTLGEVQPVMHRGLLTVDESGGILRTAQVIDRDLICPGRERCVIALQVQVKSPRFQIILVDVTIEDVNDNRPMFPSATVQRSLTEASLVGASLTLPTADDLDGPSFGVQSYKLTGSTEKFRLNINRADGTIVVKLELRGRLDRESIDSYSVQLIAFDGGVPPRSGSITVNIQVLDVNDNNPQFENQTYHVSVKENVKLKSVVIRVTAHDTDIGANGALTYRFASKTLRTLGQLFSINQTSGDVSVTGNLDYEESSSYTLTVLAQDKNPDSLAQTTVVVSVVDLNDNAPQIKLNEADSDGSVQISELAETGSFVAHVTVRDPDGGVNGMFGCSLKHDHFAIVQLYETEFKIISAAAFNREAIASYDVEIVCEDRGIPPQSSSMRVSVNVVDENDHNPRFRQPTYRATIFENDRNNPFLVAVEAFDEDVGENADITYQLQEDVSGMFSIDGISGNLTAKVPLDYEQVHRIQINVLAVDHGEPALTGTAAVIIDVLDTDDEDPKFSQSHYEFEVTENEAIDTSVDSVYASDADSAQYNKFVLSMHPDSDSYETFALDSNSGVIYTRKVLDREEQDVYELTILAVSVGLRAFTSTAIVSVTVADKNDNSPEIRFPNPQNNTLYISNQIPVGITVARVLAEDSDVGANGLLNYTILSGNEAGLFRIDGQTGLIRVAKDLTAIENRAYGLVLVVTDNGDKPRSMESLISLVVNRSVVYPLANASDDLKGQNLTIVICIAVLSGVLMAVLLVAIVVLLRQRRSTKNGKYNYAARVMDQKAAICNAQKMTGGGEDSNGSCQDLFPSKYDSGTVGRNAHNDSFTSEAPSIATNASSLQLTGANIQPTSPKQLLRSNQNVRPTPLRVESNGKSWELPTLYEQHHVAPETAGKTPQSPVSGHPSTPPDKDSDSGCSADMSNTTDCTKNSHDNARLHAAPAHWDLTRTNLKVQKRAAPPQPPYSGSPKGKFTNPGQNEGLGYSSNYRDLYQTFKNSPMGLSSHREPYSQKHFLFEQGQGHAGIAMEDSDGLHYEMNV